MNKEILIDNIKAANKNISCDLVVKNISVVDVYAYLNWFLWQKSSALAKLGSTTATNWNVSGFVK